MIALSLTLAFKLRPQETAVLGTAGSMAAISALFGGPLVGAMMMLEGGIGLGAAILPVLLPGFVAAATGYVVFLGFGDWGGLGTKSISVPNLPDLTSAPITDLFLAVVVGLAAALLITVVRRVATFVTRGERDWLVFLIPAGGLAVGCIAELADLLGAHSQDVLFSGQASVPTLVTETSAWIVLLLLVAKALAYAISLGCGFRGGPVFPAIFLGVGLATFTEIAFNVSSTAAVAIGAAVRYGGHDAAADHPGAVRDPPRRESRDRRRAGGGHRRVVRLDRDARARPARGRALHRHSGLSHVTSPQRNAFRRRCRRRRRRGTPPARWAARERELRRYSELTASPPS